MRKTAFIFLGIVFCLFSCKERKSQGKVLFEVRDSKSTGIDFSNDLAYDQKFNLFRYIYFYNGSGVGAGDFNGDGLVDIFFGSNQHQDRLYLNKGGLKFNDVTKASGIPDDGGWTTGISVVDINNDGLADIYVCRVGNYEVLHSHNLLLVNQGIDNNGTPHFRDEAKEYGLDFSGFSTQAAFFDYDNDGDLDMFLLNHSVHENGTFRPRKEFEGSFHPLSGDRIFRNDGKKFTDVTAATGINSTAIGYGLGIAIADVNMDGYPDIYIGNDFHENDYLYINQRNGTFREEGRDCLMHTSQFTMGVDVADVNNDACPEIISLDMLPSDPYILKRSLGEDAYDIFQYKLSVGYGPQFTRNNLQYNRRNGMFSETGLYSGVAATDWSWAPLWMDFDNDGHKDLFISNGIPKRMNDIDYINFVSNGEVQQKIRSNAMDEKDLSLIDKFPEISLPNKFFRNIGGLKFEDEGGEIKGDAPGFSNGAVYADLDNDGDLDIVTNNIDHAAMVYENKTETSAQPRSARLLLKGPADNLAAIGSMLVVFKGNEKRTYENFPVKGFLSSMQVPMVIGLAGGIDSALMIWPDRSYQKVNLEPGQQTITYTSGLPSFDFSTLMPASSKNERMMEQVPNSGIDFLHRENHFVEFDREPLIPHMVSTESPCLAVADINGDGLEDLFIGASRDQPSAVFIQAASGKFQRMEQPALYADSSFEDVAACWSDVNGDGYADLLVASGGNEFYGNDPHNTPRLYLNDGKGVLTRLPGAFGNLSLTASCILVHDMNGDGRPDVFIGARALPWAYGALPHSYFLLNDGQGKFIPMSGGPDVSGFVTNAVWSDLDGDKKEELVVSYEWGGIAAFTWVNGKWEKKELTEKKGWWNFALPVDVDGDGDLDLVAGNLGLNSRLHASVKEPVRLYYNDFDDNGRKEQVLSYYLDGKEIPFANKMELEKQIPVMKKKFLYAGDFAKAGMNELFGSAKLEGSEVRTADYFANSVLINQGNFHFETKALPWEAQLTTYRDAVVVDANGDRLPDILLVGNYYDSNIEMGRYDADFGTLLINRGNGNFEPQNLPGLTVKGQVRHVAMIQSGKTSLYIFARNNDSVMVGEWKDAMNKK